MRPLADALLALLRTRAELFGVELQEETERFKRSVFLGVCAVLFAAFAMLFVALFLLALFWETHRLLVIGLAAGVFAVAALWLLAALRAQAAGRPPLFSATLAELERDRHDLAGRHE